MLYDWSFTITENNYQQLTSLNFSECEEGIGFGYHGNKCMDNLTGEGKVKPRAENISLLRSQMQSVNKMFKL